MAVKRQGMGDPEAFHHRKAGGIREGEAFICVLEDDRQGAPLVSDRDPLDPRGTLGKLTQEGGRMGLAEAG